MTPRSTVDFEKINRAALAVLPAILRRLLPSGKFAGPEYLAKNPRRADRSLGSFSINTRTGKWGDFAESDAAGGDPVSLVAYMESVSQIEAARLLERMLGVDAEGKASRRERA